MNPDSAELCRIFFSVSDTISARGCIKEVFAVFYYSRLVTIKKWVNYSDKVLMIIILPPPTPTPSFWKVELFLTHPVKR